MKKKIVYVLLALSLLGNILLGVMTFLPEGQEADGEADTYIIVDTPGANSRVTYFQMHHIEKAQEYSKGAGVKIGILDWGFGYKDHPGLYAGGKDFIGEDYNFNSVSEHGYWMANVLKEVAPECEVYALETFVSDSEDKWVDALIEAIGWAEENDIDILTLSHQMISKKNRSRLDQAVNHAVESGIVTTFIHYDNPVNLMPFVLFDEEGKEYSREGYDRSPDVGILDYDYNTLFVDRYLEYEKDGCKGNLNNLYLSVSSTSPVAAGFVALLKSLNPDLWPAQYKEILVDTSYETEFEGRKAVRVVDIGKAADCIMENYK